MKIVGLSIILIILNLYIGVSESTNPFILNDLIKKDASIITPIDNFSGSLFLINNELLNRGFTINLFDVNEKKVNKFIYINNLYSLSSYKSDSIYNLSTDGKNIKLITVDLSLNNYREIKLSKSTLSDISKNYKIIKEENNKLLLVLNNKLVQFDKSKSIITNELQLFDTDSLIVSNDKLFLIRISNTNANLYLVDDNFQMNYLSDLTVYDDFKIESADDLLFFITSTEGSNESLIQVIKPNQSKVETIYWVNSKINNIVIFNSDEKTYLLYIENDNLHNKIILNLLKDGKIYSEHDNYEITWNFYGINGLYYTNKSIIVLFKNGLIQLGMNLDEISKDQFDLDFVVSSLTKFENIIFLASDLDTKIIYYKDNDLMYPNLIWRFLINYGFILILLTILAVLTLSFRRKRRFYNEILRHPALGCIYYLDSKGRLILANNEGQLNLKLNNNIPLKRHFSYYAKNVLNQKISNLITKSYDDRKNIKEKILITENGITKDWLINTFILRNIAGMIRGVVVSANDITEQLERQRLTNLASFAHDMQTNLSTIRLNAEQIECRDELAQSKKKKILFQTNVLTQRVRDLLAVGRDDLLELDEVIADEIIQKVFAEFDNEIYPEIKFQSSGNNLKVICDVNKISRGLRNAVENSIKYLPEKKGNISINVTITQDKQFYCFSVEDDGIGMDSELKNKVLTPYFTTAKKTGGSGIGSIIMQKVAELHNGKIEIDSELNKGTKVNFFVPINYVKSLKNNRNKNE